MLSYVSSPKHFKHACRHNLWFQNVYRKTLTLSISLFNTIYLPISTCCFKLYHILNFKRICQPKSMLIQCWPLNKHESLLSIMFNSHVRKSMWLYSHLQTKWCTVLPNSHKMWPCQLVSVWACHAAVKYSV